MRHRPARIAVAVALLVSAVPLVAAADASAGPPKPGKCSVAADGVGTAGDGTAAWIVLAAVAGAAGARRRRAE